MAYFLRSQGDGDYVNLTSTTLSNYRFVFDVVNNISGTRVLSGSKDSLESFIAFRSDNEVRVQLFFPTRTLDFTFSSGFTVSPDRLIVEFEGSAAGGSVSVTNGGVTETQTTTVDLSGFVLETFFRRGDDGTSSSFDLYRAKLFDGTDTLTNDWDPSASNGTGSILPDTVGINDGTLVNFPTDDSQWVFYDDGGAVTGTGSPQAQTATASGTGERVVTGSGTPTAQTATASGTGSVTGTVTGSGAVQAQAATASGVGERIISGSGTPQAATATTSGTGTTAGNITGSGSVTAQPSTVSGTGTRIVTGLGTAQATGATASGTGQVAGAISGTGAVKAQRATATGVGLRVITGQGTGQAQRATASGTGSVQGAITGTGAAQAQRATATGVGLRVITGSGSVQAQRATAEGSDRGFLPRPVVKPGSIDIQPKYGTTDIQPKYGTTDY